MLILGIILVMSLGLSAFFFIYFEFYNAWYNYFLLIPFILGSFILIFSVYFLFLVIGSFILKKRNKNSNSKFLYFIVKETAGMIYFASNIRIKKYNMELEPRDEKYLLVSNHKSNFDPFLLYNVLKTNPLSLVTKPQNTEIPIFGPWIKYTGSIVISINDNFAAVKGIAQAINYIKNGITTVGIYPEGKRYFDEGMLDFHAGSFKIATKSKCPIVVAAGKNTEQIKFRFPKRTKVEFKIIKVLNYEDYKDLNTQELAKYCHDLIYNELYGNK